MSSHFVSGGTLESGSGQAAPSSTSQPTRPHIGNTTTTEWAKVQQELENARKERAEQRIKAASGEEKSLYEILQANKAAKQAAFEEQNKIKNQFRALDDDEIDFLDEVKAAERMAEEKVRRETEDGLRAFREQQRRSGGVDGGGHEAGGLELGMEWSTGRKRKRKKERGTETEKEKEKGKERSGLTKRKTGGGKGKGKKAYEDAVAVVERRSLGCCDKAMQEVVRDKGHLVAKETETETETGGGATGRKTGGLVSYGSEDSDDE